MNEPTKRRPWLCIKSASKSFKITRINFLFFPVPVAYQSFYFRQCLSYENINILIKGFNINFSHGPIAKQGAMGMGKEPQFSRGWFMGGGRRPLNIWEVLLTKLRSVISSFKRLKAERWTLTVDGWKPKEQVLGNCRMFQKKLLILYKGYQ